MPPRGRLVEGGERGAGLVQTDDAADELARTQRARRSMSRSIAG